MAKINVDVENGFRVIVLNFLLHYTCNRLKTVELLVSMVNSLV